MRSLILSQCRENMSKPAKSSFSQCVVHGLLSSSGLYVCNPAAVGAPLILYSRRLLCKMFPVNGLGLRYLYGVTRAEFDLGLCVDASSCLHTSGCTCTVKHALTVYI